MAVLDQLYRQVVLPVLRSESAARAEAAVHALRGAGGELVELTTSTPDWADAVRRLARSGATIGVGTIRGPDDARRALAAGAAFLVSPFPVPGVADEAAAAGVPFLPGGFTPGELNTAAADGGIAGTAVVKVFPAHLGGPRYLRSLAPVLPGVRLVPTGGIGWADVPAYVAAGAFAVGIGSGLDLPADQLRDAFARVRR